MVTGNNEYSADAASVARVASLLKAMKQTGIGVGQGDGEPGGREGRGIRAIVLALRKAIGETLPFLFDEATMGFPNDQVHWYAHTNRMDYRLFLCDRCGFDDSCTYETFSMPEVRHLTFGNLLQETIGCARESGWDHGKERIYALLSASADPVNGRELVLTRFSSLMLRAPAEPLSPEAAERLYGRLLEGIDLIAAETAQDEGRSALERRRAILQVACAQPVRDYPEHPLIRAVIAFKIVTMLRPFQAANLFMARLLFSWILFEAGMSAVSVLPFVDFLNRWERSQEFDQQAYRLFAPYADTAADADNSYDWTAYSETVLEFFAHELNRLSNKLHGFRLRRARLAEIFAEDKSTNVRQKEVLVEALVHEDAEFSYTQFMERFDVTYATAYVDLGSLEERGYLQVKKKGKQAYFIAPPDVRARIHEHLREVSPVTYDVYYDTNGELREMFTSARAEASRLENPTFERRDVFDAAFPSFDPSRAHRAILDP